MENNILSLLTKEEKRFLITKFLNKNDILFNEDQKCEFITIVIFGEIKISSFSFEGEELIYNILNKNEVIGNNLIFSDEPFYKGNVIATKEAVVVNIKKENLIYLLQSNQNFLIAYLNAQSNFGKKLNSTIKLLSFNSAEERIKFYLFENNNVINYKFISDLATILHLKRETLSRALSKLEKENVIKRSHHRISLL